MTKPPSPPTPDKKRASPVPEPETEALRCRRQVRQLDEQIASLRKTLSEKIATKEGERATAIRGLSAEASVIFAKLAEVK